MPARTPVLQTPVVLERIDRDPLYYTAMHYPGAFVMSPEALGALRKVLTEMAAWSARAVAQQWAAANVRFRAHTEKLNRKQYVLRCLQRTPKEGALRHSVAEGRRTVERLRKEFVQAVRTTREAEVRLEGRSPEILARTFGNDYDMLRSMDKVLRVRVTGLGISIYTTTLYCDVPEYGERYEIGRFRIELRFDGKVRWYNLTRQFEETGYRHAPHVGRNGKACLGNTEYIFPELIGSGEFAAAGLLAIQFVESVNLSDPWGRSVVYWPRAKT